MAVVDIYSKRQKRLSGDAPDVFAYNLIPEAVRVQVVHIWDDVVPLYSHFGQKNNHAWAVYDSVVSCLCREYGVFSLPVGKGAETRTPRAQLVAFFLTEECVEKVLDVVELSFRSIEAFATDFHYHSSALARSKIGPAIEELNARFLEHGVGYQYTNGEIIRMDSELIHAEVIRPALRLLNQKCFAGAQEEFLKAHEHYRHGRTKEALNECLKSFESVMKAICDKRRWMDQNTLQTAPAKQLLETCKQKGLFPAFWQSSYTSLMSLLEGSVPTGRNKLGGHGQGTTPVEVPNHLAAYMLHMTASAIVFFAECDSLMP